MHTQINNNMQCMTNAYKHGALDTNGIFNIKYALDTNYKANSINQSNLLFLRLKHNICI